MFNQFYLRFLRLFFVHCIFLSGAFSVEAQYRAVVLPPLEGYSNSQLWGAEGNWAVGGSFDNADEMVPTLWIGGQPYLLGQKFYSIGTLAMGIGNGIIVGSSWTEYGPNNVAKGLFWDLNRRSNAYELPGLAPYAYVSARAISSDGGTIVGYSAIDIPPNSIVHAVRWRRNQPPLDLGTLAGPQYSSQRNSSARGVSRDGSVIVGQSQIDVQGAYGRAFVWTEVEGMRELPNLPSYTALNGPRDILSIAYATAGYDLIVGQAGGTGLPISAAAWIGPDHQLTLLSSGGGAHGVNANRLVVGYSAFPEVGNRATLWDINSEGPARYDLNDLVSDWVGDSLDLTMASAISDSGVIVVNGSIPGSGEIRYFGRGVILEPMD